MKPAPLKIGSLTVDPPVVLAPMAGFTDTSFRSICRAHGSGLVFTEVANAEGIVHGSRPTLHLLETSPGERPVAAHIYGSQPEPMAAAAAIIEKLGHFDLIDINGGCPMRKIVAKGAGAALMGDPERTCAIVRAVAQAVSLPVTVKTRIGLRPDRMNVSEMARAIQEGGASAISIHGRFASRQHSGEADWEALARVKSELRIPVLGNGGVEAAADAVAMFERTGVDGVMIGRAAIGNPWIFDEIGCLLAGRPYTPHTMAEHRAMIEDQLRRLIALKTLEYKHRRRRELTVEQSAALQFRAHLVKYLHGFRHWVDVRRSLNTMTSCQAVMDAVDLVISRQTAT